MLDGGFIPDRLFQSVESFIVFWTHEGTGTLARLAVDLPAEAWWVPALVLILLGIAALVDAVDGRVPDPLVLAGLLATTAAQGLYADWPLASRHLLFGFGAAMALWGVNQLYYTAVKRDAFGMGDAKWTAVAVAAFGLKPALWAWVIGAWLGLGWLGLKKAYAYARRLASAPPVETGSSDHIHFAPFLFTGLLAGLYWYYLR
ncbi:MAG: prepilin peptidase [Alphaproteobacteria bacterium]|nr:prepilin peptidase [Alphaproteobacteria bacterium]